MNDDSISRQAAVDALHQHFADGFEEDRWWNSTHVLVALKSLPSAEPEIIRCKDCRHWREKSVCGLWDRDISNGDHYCSFAERKDGEADESD